MKTYGCTIETRGPDRYVKFDALTTEEAWQVALSEIEEGERLVSIWMPGSRRIPRPKPKVLRMDEKTKREVQLIIQEWRNRDNRYSAQDCARILENYIGDQKESRRVSRKSRQYS